MPNLVQTTEGTPAMVHTGPFGNIAHGTSSIISQRMGVRLADYVVNEAGFAADLGAEKYFDIVMRSSGITPACAVLVTTVQSLRNQGEGELERGFPNLARHIENLRTRPKASMLIPVCDDVHRSAFRDARDVAQERPG